MRRVVPILVVLAHVCLLAVACSGYGEEASAPPPDAGVDSATAPDAGGGDASPDAADIRKPVLPLAFVTKKIFVGDTDRAGKASNDAWQLYGRDIDGIASDGNPKGECKPVAGAAPAAHVDAPGGIDNSFGRNVLPFVKAIVPKPTDDANAAIASGVRTSMISLDGNGGFFVYSETTSMPPTFDLSETRLVAAEWTEVGTGAKSKIAFGGVGSDGFYESGTLVGPTLMVALFGGQATKPLPLRAPSFRMKISADGLTATEGIVSGVLPTEALVTEVNRVAGNYDATLCNSPTLKSIDDQIRQASDIMQDGTQDPTRECDGISFALGFEMTRVIIGAAAPPTQPPGNPCQ